MLLFEVNAILHSVPAEDGCLFFFFVLSIRNSHTMSRNVFLTSPHWIGNGQHFLKENPLCWTQVTTVAQWTLSEHAHTFNSCHRVMDNRT
jgi:hypothetical protein